jgi:hypothetical protein
MRRTGDKALILDGESDDIFVLMNLDNYEEILDVLDVPPAPPSPLPTTIIAEEPKKEPADEENTVEAEALDDYVLDEVIDEEEKAQKTAETVPGNTLVTPPTEPAQEEVTIVPVSFADGQSPVSLLRQEEKTDDEGSEEGLADVPNDGEEEKFYLEPVE